MHLRHLSLSDFRSYASVELGLDTGPTAFLGRNGQGKTNLVEAVNYLATLGSHRVATDAPLVRLGAERAVVRGAVERGGRAMLVEVEIAPGRSNRARLNRSPVPRARDVLGALRTVLFAPEDLALVKGDPAERRRFLDDLLVVRAPRFAGVRQDYDRILRQRNTLLRSAGWAVRGRAGDLATLDVWDDQLARIGAELLAARLALVQALEPLVEKAYATLVREGGAADGPTALDYRSSTGDEALPTERAALADVLVSAMRKVRTNELERGVSLVGPHRDELLLKLGAFPAKGYASHGESWSFALALRLASYDLLCADGAEPVLLLDDVFAELDTFRRDRLAELVAAGEQVLVTAAVEDDVPPALLGAKVHVSAGEVRRVA